MKSLAVLGATVLIGSGFVAMSCSSDPTSGGNNGGTSGGATSTSTSTSSSGGNTSSSGGAPSTGGKTSTSTSTTPTTGCKITDTAPSGDLLGGGGGDDAGAGDAGGGVAIKGGFSNYGGDYKPSYELDGSTLTITENVTMAPSAAQYVGTVFYFNNCVNAEQKQGVLLTISGSVTGGCTVQMSANYSGATDATIDPKGTCTLSSCYAPQKTLGNIPSSPTELRYRWEDFTGGSPSGTLDEGKLTGIQWQFTIPAGSTCTATLTITDLSFF